MSVKAVREFHGKQMLCRNLKEDYKGVLITPSLWSSSDIHYEWDRLPAKYPWLLKEKLVVKPDQLIKRRGKKGLIKVNCTFEECKEWITERLHKEITIENVQGVLTHFLIEPFLPHKQEDEYYVAIQSHRYYDEIFFFHEGGVNIGDVDAKAERLKVKTSMKSLLKEDEVNNLLCQVPLTRRKVLADYIMSLFALYVECHFAYLEINPLVVVDGGASGQRVVPLDLAAKIDETAAFLVDKRWGEVDFPPPFGRGGFPEEEFIRKLDEKTGASLKLTVLNPNGRVWLMVAGGGASVVYSDTVVDFGYGSELANYGEYSGAPTADETYQYAKTLFTLMCKGKKNPSGKVFVVGGGIANFTDVSSTFGGLIKAVKAYQEELKEQKVSFWVRRAGLNFLEGLRRIKEAVRAMGLPIRVYGPETHMTAIVPMSLGLMEVLEEPDLDAAEYLKISGGRPSNMLKHNAAARVLSGQSDEHSPSTNNHAPIPSERHPHEFYPLRTLETQDLTPETTCIVYNLQQAAVQRMLDFDGICGRQKPSVSAVVFPFGGRQNMKVYWGVEEIFIPVYPTIAAAVEENPEVSFMINFASFRSSYDSTMEALQFPKKLRTIAIIAEGMPERQTRELIAVAEAKGVSIIGPATVGGIKPGCFRIGNTGGAIENIIMSKLYRPGSVAYVSRSGGMSNELNNIICRNTNGVAEGVAVGGDRYPGTRFLDHILRYQKNPNVKMMVLLGEVGGLDEYEVLDAVKDGRITKPVVAWCVGTCAAAFGEEMQFGHAGAQSRSDKETAKAKNHSLAQQKGITVPSSFDDLGNAIRTVFMNLVQNGEVPVFEEPEVPQVPKDFKTLQKLGVVRPVPANMVCSISDDRGDEVTYGGMKLSNIMQMNQGVGSVISLLWFKRNLPVECCKFMEMILMVCADHGPAVSGAHNAIVCARAGKDVVDSLCSGLLTIGPRFGGALDAAAKSFTKAFDAGLAPRDYVDTMKKKNELIMGIGHRIKSKHNPDKRVEILKKFALSQWSTLDPHSSVLGYALGVEEVTITKKANLILNVDGCVAAAFVDMLRRCGAFTREESDQLVDAGCLNALFVLSRSIGLIGHVLDQKRLNQGLYRHPFTDIAYIEDRQEREPRNSGAATPNVG
eukprot:CAMPEP_0179008908 /NCGR_PEP_ID=MMETSP0795-20121207/15985_1 /TAXON_ID=88552 /ORGANISM="Amoebophrya sp., Strain Ameob2" /LENGTH=1129 /DNA_ID=CAMNT_0020704061 /DNA_START=81 /DNA_END=3470 /DNA_ORIENTATION=-